MPIKTHQYISILIVVFVILAVLWPLIVHAVTGDEVVYHTSPTEFTALLPATGAPAAPKLPRNGVMERIAYCESKNVATAKNSRSTASGRFQFLKGSWEYYGMKKWGTLEGRDVFNYDDNTELAYWVYEREGTTPWLASSHCWG